MSKRCLAEELDALAEVLTGLDPTARASVTAQLTATLSALRHDARNVLGVVRLEAWNLEDEGRALGTRGAEVTAIALNLHDGLSRGIEILEQLKRFERQTHPGGKS